VNGVAGSSELTKPPPSGGVESTLTLPSDPLFGTSTPKDSTRGAHLVVLVGPDVGRRHEVREDQVIGRSQESEIHTDDEGASRRHARIRRVGRDYEVEDLGSRNGTYLNGARIKRAPLNFGDKIAVGEGTVFLFTRHDAFEDRLLQAQRLQALAQIAGGIGHDFNNMLGAALTNVTHLRELGPSDPATLETSLSEVESAVRRAVGLASQLLAFSESRRPVMRPVDVSRLMDDAMRLIRSTLERSVVLSGSIEPGLVVLGDSSQLLQALMNLCINAGDSMPEGGRLTLRASREPTGEPGVDSVVLWVEDTGQGMDPVTRDRVFEPFFAQRSRSRAAGMGLAGVYAIIRDHGGSIRVESEVGEGTRFEIRLPMAEPAKRRFPSGPWPKAETPEGAVVLLVDDEELVRSALSRVLEHAGLEVLTASDGAEALEAFDAARDRIDLVILDLDMPVMNGEQAFVELRERKKDVPVLISSGFSNPEREAELVEAGVDGVLRKPYDAATLLSAVSSLISRRADAE
jgi:signal transduction histidine kinase/CheY-like chemotaxis protein